MSRIANAPIELPKGVEVNIQGQAVQVKGSKGALEHTLHDLVGAEMNEGVVRISAREQSKSSVALAGTSRALVANMVTGVSQGFERKLEINGVGYRAQMKGKTLNLSLGYSHPVDFAVPEGIEIETPSQTEIIVKGIDKQLVGQVAANIRAWRKPEPYKGKGIKYSDEHIQRKEAKKT